MLFHFIIMNVNYIYFKPNSIHNIKQFRGNDRNVQQRCEISTTICCKQFYVKWSYKYHNYYGRCMGIMRSVVVLVVFCFVGACLSLNQPSFDTTVRKYHKEKKIICLLC